MRMNLLCALLFVSASALAQSAPPIKPGLWQVHSDREVDGQKLPDMSAQLKNMPPEQRRQLEAMMKQRGVDMSAAAGGDLKICLSKDSLDKGQWQQSMKSSGCKTDYSSQTSSRWAWKSVCTQPAATMEGEALFSSPEAYTVKTAITMNMNGQSKVTHMTLASKWLAADCGDVKPLSPKQP